MLLLCLQNLVIKFLTAISQQFEICEKPPVWKILFQELERTFSAALYHWTTPFIYLLTSIWIGITETSTLCKLAGNENRLQDTAGNSANEPWDVTTLGFTMEASWGVISFCIAMEASLDIIWVAMQARSNLICGKSAEATGKRAHTYLIQQPTFPNNVSTLQRESYEQYPQYKFLLLLIIPFPVGLVGLYIWLQEINSTRKSN